MTILADEIGGLDERPMVAEMCALCTHDVGRVRLRWWSNGANAHLECVDRVILEGKRNR